MRLPTGPGLTPHATARSWTRWRPAPGLGILRRVATHWPLRTGVVDADEDPLGVDGGLDGDEWNARVGVDVADDLGREQPGGVRESRVPGMGEQPGDVVTGELGGVGGVGDREPVGADAPRLPGQMLR